VPRQSLLLWKRPEMQSKFYAIRLKDVNAREIGCVVCCSSAVHRRRGVVLLSRQPQQFENF